VSLSTAQSALDTDTPQVADGHAGVADSIACTVDVCVVQAGVLLVLPARWQRCNRGAS